VSEAIAGGWPPPARPRLKVCCIASVAEARLAISAGADALGLVSAMPSGPGVIAEELIAEIVAAVPPPVATFLLTARVDAAGIAAQVTATRASTVQLVDAVPLAALEELRLALPATKLVQVVHVLDADSVREALDAAPLVDALLLDSGDPRRAVKELGGTGRVHDWALSRAVVERAPVPVFLAGGLRAENVGEAVRRVRPFGVDLCSGVRTDGRLDAARLAALVDALVRSLAAA
jgi:phosphoribosylanthranilate isomerase